eukprot:14371028-Alexandrium_andersonii.AAC.1
MQPSRASGTNFEAVPGPPQCKLRTLAAVDRFSAGRTANNGRIAAWMGLERIADACWAPCH